MSHPSDQQLAEFIYDDLDDPIRAEVAAHVSSCDACRQRIESWREVRVALKTWGLPEVRRPLARPIVAAAVRWATAACIFITCGFAIARLTAPRPTEAARVDVQAIRAALKQELSMELDRRIRRIEAARLAEYAGLREDVETVALRTQEEFLRLTSASGRPGSNDGSN